MLHIDRMVTEMRLGKPRVCLGGVDIFAYDFIFSGS